MNLSSAEDLDSLDFHSAVVDEISLEGLDGITLPALWLRLERRPNFPLPIDSDSKEFIWSAVRSDAELELFLLPSARHPLVVFDRFQSLDEDFGVVVESKAMPPDPYPFAPIDDRGRARGSCTTYYTRHTLPDTTQALTLQQLHAEYGARVVIVASQRLRNNCLVPAHIMDLDSELSLGQYLQMERIGRSRYHGEITVGEQSLAVLKETPKNLYYIRKKLIESGIITKQNFFLRLRNAKGAQGRLYHLPRFHREFRPKFHCIIERCVDALKNQPNHTMLVSKMAEQFENPSVLKKVAKHSDFQRFIRFETVLHRTVFPDAPVSEWCIQRTGTERSVRVYRLLDPQVDVIRALNDDDDQEANVTQSSTVQDNLSFPDQSRLSLVHSMERQAYMLLLSHGPAGIDVNNIKRELGQTPLDARALLKAIASIPGATFTYREDVGKCRITKYVASRYSHLNSGKRNMSLEETMLKSMLNKCPAEGSLNMTEDNDVIHGDAIQYAVMDDVINTDEQNLSQISASSPARDSCVPAAASHQQPVFLDVAAVVEIGQQPTAADEDLAVTASPRSGECHVQVTSLDDDVTPSMEVEFQLLPDDQTDTTTNCAELPSSLPINLFATEIVEEDEFFVRAEDWMLEKFDPVTGLRLTADVNVPLEDTDIFSKSSSSRLMKRTRFVWEFVQRMKIVDQAFHLKQMLQNMENEEQVTTRIDRRSFYRILQRLAEARLINNFRLTLTKNGVNARPAGEAGGGEGQGGKSSSPSAAHKQTFHMVTDRMVSFGDKLLASCIQTCCAGFLVQSRGKNTLDHSAGHKRTNVGAGRKRRKLGADEPASDGECDAVGGAYDDKDDEAQDELNLSAWMQSAGAAGDASTPRVRPSLPHKSAVRNTALTSKQLPKFRRLNLLHEVLFYMGRAYSGVKQRDQTALKRLILRQHPDVSALLRAGYHSDSEQEASENDIVGGGGGGGEQRKRRMQLPTIYSWQTCGESDAAVAAAGGATGNCVVTWQTFISPPPYHSGWGNGWLLLCDVLMRLPLCVFVRLVRLMYVTPLLLTYSQHPILQHLPVSCLPAQIIACLRWRRKYMFAVHEDVTRLCFMGLVQFGQQLPNKDQVFIYVNRNASLLDTVLSSEGYNQVESDVTYPRKECHFTDLVSVTHYWNDLRSIALATPLGVRSLCDAHEKLVSSFDKPSLIAACCERQPGEVEQYDTGDRPGDQLGAAGIDSSMFTHTLRNWRDKTSQVVGTQYPQTPARRVKRSHSGDDKHFSSAAKHAKSKRVSASKLRQPHRKHRDVSAVAEADASSSLWNTSDLHQLSCDADTELPQLPAVTDLATHSDPVPTASTSTTVTSARIGATGTEVAPASAVPRGVTRGTRRRRPVGTRRGPAASAAAIVAASTRFLERRLRSARRRLTPRDHVDKEALRLLIHSRCRWSERETSFLLLARAVIQLLTDGHMLCQHHCVAARDALHAAYPESRDKTTCAIRRRMHSLVRREAKSAHLSLLYQEMRARPDVLRILASKSDVETDPQSDKFHRLISLLTSKPTVVQTIAEPLAHNYAHLCERYEIFEGDHTLAQPQPSSPEIDSLDAATCFTIKTFIIGYLAALQGDKKPSPSVVYHTLRNYSEFLSKSAISQLLRAGTLSRVSRRRYLIKRLSNDYNMLDISYAFSNRFCCRFITRYQFGIIDEMYHWFKTLLLYSLTGGATYVDASITSSGQAASFVSLCMLNKLEYEIVVPECLYVMNDFQKTAVESAMTKLTDQASSSDILAECCATAAVQSFKPSSSRAVMMALRESQLTYSSQAVSSSNNTHLHHDALQMCACQLKVQLRRPASSQADSPVHHSFTPQTGAEDGSCLAVDNSYILVTPQQISAVVQRHTRYWDVEGESRDSVLQRLAADNSWSSELLQQADQLLIQLDSAGAMGVLSHTAPKTLDMERALLCRLVAELVECQLVLCVGERRRRWVSRLAAEPWLLRSYHVSRLHAEKMLATDVVNSSIPAGVEPVCYVPAPWRRVGGSLNRRMLDRLLGTVLSVCLQYAGCRLPVVFKHFAPMLAEMNVYDVVLDLETLGAVQLMEHTCECSDSLFSSREDVRFVQNAVDLCSDVDHITVVPTEGALMKVACFIGDKAYNQVFFHRYGM